MGMRHRRNIKEIHVILKNCYVHATPWLQMKMNKFFFLAKISLVHQLFISTTPFHHFTLLFIHLILINHLPFHVQLHTLMDIFPFSQVNCSFTGLVWVWEETLFTAAQIQ